MINLFIIHPAKVSFRVFFDFFQNIVNFFPRGKLYLLPVILIKSDIDQIQLHMDF